MTFSSAFFTFGRIPRLAKLLPLDTDANEPILRPDPLVGQRLKLISKRPGLALMIYRDFYMNMTIAGKLECRKIDKLFRNGRSDQPGNF